MTIGTSASVSVPPYAPVSGAPIERLIPPAGGGGGDKEGLWIWRTFSERERGRERGDGKREKEREESLQICIIPEKVNGGSETI